MKNDTIKKFDTFVSHNFFGYSAHTLYQELCHSYPAEVASQWVYVNIWHTFIDNDTPEDIDIARHVACIIIGDPNFESEHSMLVIGLSTAWILRNMSALQY